MTDTQDEDEEELLVETVRRAQIFEVLDDRALDGSDLDGVLSMSRSTIHRAMESLQEKGFVRRSEGKYELTGTGRVVAEALDEFQSEIETAQELEPFLNTVEGCGVELPIELFVDAEVTQTQARQAHVAVKRIIECIEASDSLQIMTRILSPLYVTTAITEMQEGMEIRVVFDEEILEVLVDEYAEEAREAFETGGFEVLVSDYVPFELFLFDDKMGMAAHDEDAIARAFVESDSAEAIRWAEDLFREYEAAATEVEPPLVGSLPQDY